jgi:hypothetical protein
VAREAVYIHVFQALEQEVLRIADKALGRARADRADPEVRSARRQFRAFVNELPPAVQAALRDAKTNLREPTLSGVVIEAARTLVRALRDGVVAIPELILAEARLPIAPDDRALGAFWNEQALPALSRRYRSEFAGIPRGNSGGYRRLAMACRRLALACGGCPETTSLPCPRPGSRQAKLLTALHHLDARSSDTRQSATAVVRQAFGPEAEYNNYKDAFDQLKIKKLVTSVTGRGGGYFLTTLGTAMTRGAAGGASRRQAADRDP